MSSAKEIAQNIAKIKKRIETACIKAGRNPDEVRLLLATKTVEAERIALAFDAGERLIGENKMQEVKEKYEALQPLPHEKHFIGHMQTNKVKEALRYGVTCIQSVDRMRLAERLQRRLEFEDKEMDVLIQVNTSFEESKFGMAPDKAVEFVKAVAQMNRIHIKGLMTIGLFSAETEKVRRCFRLLRDIRDEVEALHLPGVEMRELSMGMSGDLETAIEEGATIVRVGTAIFGERPYPDSYYWNEGR